MSCSRVNMRITGSSPMTRLYRTVQQYTSVSFPTSESFVCQILGDLGEACIFGLSFIWPEFDSQRAHSYCQWMLKSHKSSRQSIFEIARAILSRLGHRMMNLALNCRNVSKLSRLAYWKNAFANNQFRLLKRSLWTSPKYIENEHDLAKQRPRSAYACSFPD